MKNHLIISCYLVGVMLLFVQSTLPYQHNSRLLTNGIFDISNEAKTQSKTTFNVHNEDGISTYKTNSISPSILKVNYTYERKEIPNPLYVNYDFQIIKLANGDYEMDMIGAMPFTSMYISPDIETNYNGTNLIYPNLPKVGEDLPFGKGAFSLEFKSTKELLLSYEVEVKNRKITKKETLSINGKDYEVYIHTYDFSQKTISKKGVLLFEINEEVTEWFIPNHGLAKQDRKGTQTIFFENKEKNQIGQYQVSNQILTLQ